MKKLLVHLHLYYKDQCDYFIEKLHNISGCEWMLYVTMIENNTEEEQKILRNFPEAKICLVENRGYDIWPFINLLQSINLDDFDYILKLHTKSFYEEAVRVNKLWYKEYEWRNIMVDCLLKDNNRFLQLLDRFESSPGTGMFCSRLFFMPLSDFLPEDTSALRKEMERIGLHTKPGHFITGTIFIARSKPFKLLQNGRINAGIFSTDQQAHSFGSTAHLYERILSFVIYAAGYKIRTISSDRLKEAYLKIVKETIQPAIEKCFSLRREGEDQIKILRVFGIKINFGDKRPLKASK